MSERTKSPSKELHCMMSKRTAYPQKAKNKKPRHNDDYRSETMYRHHALAIEAILLQIIDFGLTPTDLLNLVSSIPIVASSLTHRHVAISAAKFNHPYRDDLFDSGSVLGETCGALKRQTVFIPLPITILRCLALNRCEHCDNRKVSASTISSYGTFLCSKCSKSFIANVDTVAEVQSHMYEGKAKSSVPDHFSFTTVKQYSDGFVPRYFMWKNPHETNGMRIGPLVTLADALTILKSIEGPVDEGTIKDATKAYLTSIRAPTEEQFVQILEIYESASDFFINLQPEKRREAACAERQRKGDLLPEFEECIKHRLRGTSIETWSTYLLRMDPCGDGFDRLFHNLFVQHLWKLYTNARCSDARRNTVKTNIQEMCDILIDCNIAFTDFPFLKDTPVQNLIRFYCAKRWSPFRPTSILDKLDKRFCDMVKQGHWLEALLKQIGDPGSCISYARQQFMGTSVKPCHRFLGKDLFRTLWEKLRGEQDIQNGQNLEGFLESFYAKVTAEYECLQPTLEAFCTRLLEETLAWEITSPVPCKESFSDLSLQSLMGGNYETFRDDMTVEAECSFSARRVHHHITRGDNVR